MNTSSLHGNDVTARGQLSFMLLENAEDDKPSCAVRGVARPGGFG